MNTHPDIYDGKQMLHAIGIDPVYVVDAFSPEWPLAESERSYLFDSHGDNILGFTSPIADLLFQNQQLRYWWKGRGFCMVLRTSPWHCTREAVLGTMVHEAAHYLADYDRPERDDRNRSRALRRFERVGINVKTSHNRRWLRATVHAWSRVNEAGYDIALGDVLDLEMYGYTRVDLQPLLTEATHRSAEPIEQILRSTYPSARSRRKLRTQRRGSSPRSRRTPAQSAMPAQQARWPRVGEIAGQVVDLHLDGSVETLATLDGRPRKRYASVQAYLDDRRRKLEQRLSQRDAALDAAYGGAPLNLYGHAVPEWLTRSGGQVGDSPT